MDNDKSPMNRMFSMRLTTSEYLLFCDKADAEGMTRAEYFRAMLNNNSLTPNESAAPVFKPTAEFYDKLALSMAASIVGAKGKDKLVAKEAAAIQAEFGVTYETRRTK